jgi:hypothetical protein
MTVSVEFDPVLQRALENCSPIKPIMIINESIDSVIIRELSLRVPSFGSAKIVESKFTRDVRLPMILE